MKLNFLIFIAFLTYNTVMSQTISELNHRKMNTDGFSIDFYGGITNPTNDIKPFVQQGNTAGITFRKKINNNLSLDVSGNYNSFSVNNESSITMDNWSSSSLSIGPQYTFNFLAFSVGLYGKLGLSFLKIPTTVLHFQDTDIITDKIENRKSASIDGRLGINAAFEIFEGISLTGNFDYSTVLNNKIEHFTRDLSSAINEKGRINYDVANQIPFESGNIEFSSMNFSIGISIDICCTGTNNTLPNPVKAQDWNSSRSNKTSNTARTGNPDGDNAQNPVKAQDWNSSRSNKTSKTTRTGNPDSGNTQNPVKAQDWNSSRSNKTSKTARTGNPDGDNAQNPAKAQDWNSSRSNKTSKTTRTGNPDGDNAQNPVKAQDWNSSRSNKTSK